MAPHRRLLAVVQRLDWCQVAGDKVMRVLHYDIPAHLVQVGRFFAPSRSCRCRNPITY
jgi:hypothetical protein